jgi:hypothetical protein
MVYIYILQLEHNKYYIGKTNDPKRRLLEHCNSEGASWTKIHKPVKVLHLIPDCSKWDENTYTLEYMSIYGIDNVRGGCFCKIYLSPEIKALIQQMINGCLDKCFNCGEEGHFLSDCKSKLKPYTKSQLYSKPKRKNMMKIIKSENISLSPAPTPSSTPPLTPPPTHPLNNPVQTSLPVPELIKLEYIFYPIIIPFQIPELIKKENPSISLNKIPELIKMF